MPDNAIEPLADVDLADIPFQLREALKCVRRTFDTLRPLATLTAPVEVPAPVEVIPGFVVGSIYDERDMTDYQKLIERAAEMDE